jgi:hypothetical protein
MRLSDVKKVLEHRIGVSLDELDDYLHCYRFRPETLMSMINYYVDEADPDQQSLEEVAGEVDGFLWNYAETGSIAPDIFLSLFKVMNATGAFCMSSRWIHLCECQLGSLDMCLL